jgi:hypothetical protein
VKGGAEDRDMLVQDTVTPAVTAER